jgi:hypothetical protein
MKDTKISAESEAPVTSLIADVVVDPKSLSRSHLLMLVSASPCPFCDDRPRLERDIDGSRFYVVGCYHRQRSGSSIQEAFALWEEMLPEFVKEHTQEVTQLRAKLHPGRRINAKLTAADWQLCKSRTPAARIAAKALNKTLSDAVNSGQPVGKVLASIWVTMARHRATGAFDTEPCAVLQTLFDVIFPERMHRFPGKPRGAPNLFETGHA